MTHDRIHRTRTVTVVAMILALGSGCPSEDEGDESPATGLSGLTNNASESSTSGVTTDDVTTSGDPTTSGNPPPTTSPPPDPDSGSDGPPPPPPARCDETPVGGETALIDDLEIEQGAAEADGNIPPNDGRTGFWFTYNDGTAGGMQDPGTPFVPEPGGAEGSDYAARTWGSGFTDWGSGMAVALNNDFSGNCPYDASSYEGISFWARGTGSVRFHVSTVATLPPESGGSCAGTCFDDYGLSVPLTDTWTQQVVTWEELSQEGWGDAVPFDTGALMEIHWQAPPGAAFDISIDTLSFWPDDAGGGSTG